MGCFLYRRFAGSGHSGAFEEFGFAALGDFKFSTVDHNNLAAFAFYVCFDECHVNECAVVDAVEVVARK